MTDNSDEQTPGGDRPKLDATGEFFSVGAPLHAVRAGYVRRPADDVLYETLMAGRYAHVIAPDRSGKSSLIAATAALFICVVPGVVTLGFKFPGPMGALYGVLLGMFLRMGVPLAACALRTRLSEAAEPCAR